MENQNQMPESLKLTEFSRSRPIIKIQDGCSQGCAYCIVPQTRGKPVSRAPADILAECRALILKGFQELVLSGINLRQYGRSGFGDFWTLLGWLDKNLYNEFGKNLRLRISSLEPGQFHLGSLDILAECKLVSPHIHLSLQHGSERILSLMGRGHYNRETILKLKSGLKNIFPVMGFGADIIVGFPGETERDVEILQNFIVELGLTYAHVFPYSRRPGSAASDFSGHISLKEKALRSKIIRTQVENLKKDFLLFQAKLPFMNVVFDSVIGRNAIKGVNEFYSTCYLPVSETIIKGVIHRVKPMELYKSGIMTSKVGK